MLLERKMAACSPDKEIPSGLIFSLVHFPHCGSAVWCACVKTDDDFLIPSDLHPALPPAFVIVDVNRLSCNHKL